MPMQILLARASIRVASSRIAMPRNGKIRESTGKEGGTEITGMPPVENRPSSSLSNSTAADHIVASLT